MECKNYPNIFVHGMLGWGKREKIYKYLPYWGMICGDLTENLTKVGYESYAVKVGALSSAWDRACELYAQITGTKVDYGKAHSEKYGHSRYGRTYRYPLVKDWGESDENGFTKKVNLLGHSFGGATMRVLVELLTNGSQKEIEATDKNELSPLFEGGHGDWVHSVSAFSSPHEGTTLFYAVPKITKFTEYASFSMANLLGNTKNNEFYDWCLEQFGLTSIPGVERSKDKMFNFEGIKKAVESKDHLWYDLTLEGAKKLNENLSCCKDTYYFSITGQMTDEDMLTKNHSHSRGMNALLWPTAKIMGKYKKNTIDDIKIDESWLPNDGCLNTISGLHPFNEPYQNYKDVKDEKLQKGIWYVMPTEHADHGKIIGGSLQYIGRGKEFTNYYINYIKNLSTLD